MSSPWVADNPGTPCWAEIKMTMTGGRHLGARRCRFIKGEKVHFQLKGTVPALGVGKKKSLSRQLHERRKRRYATADNPSNSIRKERKKNCRHSKKKATTTGIITKGHTFDGAKSRRVTEYGGENRKVERLIFPGQCQVTWRRLICRIRGSLRLPQAG